jgi:hypothetical protein
LRSAFLGCCATTKARRLLRSLQFCEREAHMDSVPRPPAFLPSQGGGSPRRGHVQPTSHRQPASESAQQGSAAGVQQHINPLYTADRGKGHLATPVGRSLPAKPLDVENAGAMGWCGSRCLLHVGVCTLRSTVGNAGLPSHRAAACLPCHVQVRPVLPATWL